MIDTRREASPVSRAMAGLRSSEALVKAAEEVRARRIRKMADDMLDIMSAKGSVDEGDLVLRGWTAEHLAKYGAEARQAAFNASEGRH